MPQISLRIRVYPSFTLFAKAVDPGIQFAPEVITTTVFKCCEKKKCSFHTIQ